MRNRLTHEERITFEAELETLQEEHRDLDAAIDALSGTGAHDQLQVARLKKRKLRLKDQIDAYDSKSMVSKNPGGRKLRRPFQDKGRSSKSS
jgi:hypothetical protein